MILVTGATGFIGGHLLDFLIEKYGKGKIVVLTSKPISKCKFLLHNDYCFDDDYFVNSGFDNIDTILHAGAFNPKSNVDANYIKGRNSNIISTTKLLTSNLPRLKKFIFFSTVDVYAYDNPITEKTLLSPSSLYGDSKAYCEQMVSAWAAQKNICHQILRIGHVYGEGEEKYKKIVPITMQRLLSDTPLQVYGDGSEIRSFIYIQDVVNAVVNVLKIKNYAGIINLVGEEKISIKELVNEIVAISGMNPNIDIIEKTTQTRDLVFNNSKMRELLYVPIVGLKEGLMKEWNYMKNLNK
jgi:nucleoside-diphosphate-sugar epimerase